MGQHVEPGSSETLLDRYEEFRCITDRCEDSCCCKWDIKIDAASRMRYLQHDDPEFVRRLDDAVSNTQEEEWVIHPKPRCPFLTDEDLCYIHATFGSDDLSLVCQTFPRTVRRINGHSERSLDTSCPEAARVLLTTEPIGFIEQVPPLRWFGEDIEVKPELLSLRSFAMELLRARDLSLEVRLFALGVFCEATSRAVNSGKLDRIAAVITRYRALVEDNAFTAQFELMAPSIDLQFQVIAGLIAGVYAQQNFKTRLDKCIEDAALTLGVGPDHLHDSTRYGDVVTTPLHADYYPALENYLVNDIFASIFPLCQGKTVFESYLYLALNFCVIRFLLMCIRANETEHERLVRVVSSFSRSYLHAKELHQNVLTHLQEHGLDTMAHAAILLRLP